MRGACGGRWIGCLELLRGGAMLCGIEKQIPTDGNKEDWVRWGAPQRALERVEDLAGGAETAAESAVNRAPMAGCISVFAGEEEGVLDGLGHLRGGMCAMNADVAVRAEREGVGRPVVGDAGFQLEVQLRFRKSEDAREGAAAEISELHFGSAEQALRARTANPASKRADVFGMGGPPDRGKFAEVEEKAQLP